MLTKILVFAVLIIGCGGIKAQSALNLKVESDEAAMEKLLKKHHIPAVGIGIIKNGKLKQIKVYGELAKGKPAPYNTFFNVASLTKPVVTMLTLKLVSSGDWSLDGPLDKYWVDPDVAADSRSKILTTRHVLTHQTGFVNWRSNHPTKKLTFDRDPGTKFGYSGEGFEYLRKALENKFGKRLEQLADSVVFQPLNMKESYFVSDKKIDQSRFALWHDTLGNKTYKTRMWSVAHAADDLVTTLEDYGNFIVAVMNGFGLSEPLFEDMLKLHSKIEENDYMGLGWEIEPNFWGKESAIMHSGGDKGVQTLVMWLPETKQGLIIFTNGDNGWKVYDELIEDTFGKKVK
jgi:CubicO group peptidase (beta-lactamase class C family)